MKTVSFERKRFDNKNKHKKAHYNKGNFKAKGRKEINKKTKVHIKFDDDARKEFLGGFQKRKQERKAYHKTRLAKQLTEERIRIKSQAKEKVGKLSSSHSVLPELVDILNAPEKTDTYDVGNVTVSITSLDDAIHQNVPEFKSEDEEDFNDITDNAGDIGSDMDDIEEKLRSLPQGKNMRTALNKETNRILQQTKAYKASQRLKQKSRKFKGKNKKKNAQSSEEPTKSHSFSSKRKGKAKGKGKTNNKNTFKGKKPQRSS